MLRGIPGLRSWGVATAGRPREQVVADIRDRVTSLPGVKVNVGQPISHRLDHIMSGVRAQVVVKVFGPDLAELRKAAQDVEERMSSVRGVVDPLEQIACSAPEDFSPMEPFLITRLLAGC